MLYTRQNMAKENMQPYKGARDFYPEDMQLRTWMFNKWRRVFERYGYVEYDAPVLERTELYLMKGNEEIIREQTYTFEDRGGRSVTVRTEMTPTVSRMVAARRQELAYPLRWYSIPNLWRYERMQRGRLREFWQPNVDIFGVSSELAELEMIQIIDDLFQAFKAKRSMYTVKINSRVLVSTMLAHFHLSDNQSAAAIRLIDRIEKMQPEAFAAELDSITGSKEISSSIIQLLAIKKIEELPFRLRETKSARSVARVIAECGAIGITNVEFDVSLMRGFDYYTDIVFEVFDNDPENSRSMFGGGRYDGLVGQFGVEPVPTVGFAFGDVTFKDFLNTHGLVPKMKPLIDVMIVIRDDSLVAANGVARELREMGVSVAVDFSERKIEKQVKAAQKNGVKYVLFVDKKDADEARYSIKNVQTNEEHRHSIHRIVSIVKDARK